MARNPQVWTQGDWDYDGDVDPIDVALWAINFTGSLGGEEQLQLAPAMSLGAVWGPEKLMDKPDYGLEVDLPRNANPDTVAILLREGLDVRFGPPPLLVAAATSIPEPGMLGPAGIGAALLLRRCRRGVC